MEDLAALNLGIEREEEEIRVRRGREKRCFRRQTFKLLGDGLVIEPPNTVFKGKLISTASSFLSQVKFICHFVCHFGPTIRALRVA